MAKIRRRFTTPLGSGTAQSLGAGDPRVRRDRSARSTSVQDPGVTSDELAALVARVVELEGADASAGAGEDAATLTLDTGDLTFEGASYLYVSFGTDGDWTADRYDGTTIDTLTGTTTKPVSLSDFQNLAWPVPAP